MTRLRRTPKTPASYIRIASAVSGFTDVPATSPYADAIRWAVDKGIAKGTSDTTFSPEATCTRGQIVTVLYRAAK